MNIYLIIKKGDVKIDVQITDVKDVKKATLKGFFRDYDVLVISDNDQCIVYPIKNILELKIKKDRS